VLCKLIRTCLSVTKCQYWPRYKTITLTVANLFTYLLHRITKSTELTKKLFLNSIFNEVLLRTVCQVLSQTHNQWIKQMNTGITSNSASACVQYCLFSPNRECKWIDSCDLNHMIFGQKKSFDFNHDLNQWLKWARFKSANPAEHGRKSLYFTMGRPFSPRNFPLPMGDLNPHLIHGPLGPAKSSTQTVSRSVQPFLQDSPVWQTDRPTDRPRYSVSNNRPHLRT